MDDLAFLSIEALAPRIHSGAVSPVALPETMLRRIGRLDPSLAASIKLAASI